MALTSAIEAYVTEYGVQPAVCARAPGRVNLIGEHIDYEGYGVLPMAIKQACCVAVGWQADAPAATTAGNAQLRVANVAARHYPAGVLPLAPAAALPAGAPSWLAYVWAAHQGCLEFAAAKQRCVPAHGHILAMVGGNVPPASGLSSSSALVVAAAMALLGLWQLPASPTEVAELTCSCERLVGTQGGGMDQAISVMGMPGLALLVEFNPVRAAEVQLPAGATFVVANSLTVSKKAETADRRYNLRVVECRLAAMVLAVALGKPAAKAASITTLKQVEPLIIDKYGPGAEAQDKAVREHLHDGVYMPDEIESLLGKQLGSIYEGNASALRVLSAVGPEGFHLRDRALHVYSEAGRVYAFRDVCTSDASNEQQLQQLGELLNASHASCAGLYQCSCEELDKLVDTARTAGALGSRLTGAGWGGCTVSLVREEDAPKFIAQLREAYYMPLVAAGVVKEEELPECLFASKPSSGAAIMQLTLAEDPLEPAAQPDAAGSQGAAAAHPATV